MGMSNCRVCGKVLTDPISVELGIGPVCRMTDKENRVERTKDMFSEAQFSYEIKDNVVVIYDLDNGQKSVTNDAENVIQKIHNELGSLDSYRVIYRDSMKIFDEIMVNENRFAGFKPLHVKTLNEALAKLKAN